MDGNELAAQFIRKDDIRNLADALVDLARLEDVAPATSPYLARVFEIEEDNAALINV